MKHDPNSTSKDSSYRGVGVFFRYCYRRILAHAMLILVRSWYDLHPAVCSFHKFNYCNIYN